MTVIVCTLDGSIGKINIDTGQIIWIHKFDSPIFSTPKYINQLNVIIIAEVIGIVHCMDTNGMEVIYKINEILTFLIHISSSPYSYGNIIVMEIFIHHLKSYKKIMKFL